MRSMPSSRTATGDLVREWLTLRLQPPCGIYVAPCKEYDAQDQMNFNGALIDVFPATPPSAERFDKWKRYSNTTPVLSLAPNSHSAIIYPCRHRKQLLPKQNAITH